jgi:CheY-like chemotaxis protein
MPEGGDLRIGLSTAAVGSSRMKPAGIQDLELSPGDWVCLSVQDTGIGMDEHVRAHLFEPFFTTKGLEGNGLGLAQVYGIVKQHRGEIGVETELGRGTTFYIYFPLHRSDQAESARAGHAAATPQGGGETILFVEDEDKVRDAGQHVLESLGYHVIVAANGREGLRVFQERKVDLVVTDMVMPDMGGQEMILALRQIAPGVKTLVVTGYTMQADIEDLKDSGITDVIHKPLDVDTLAQAVRRLLDSERSMT